MKGFGTQGTARRVMLRWKAAVRREGLGQMEDGQTLGAWKSQEWEQYKNNLNLFQHLIFEFQMRLIF